MEFVVGFLFLCFFLCVDVLFVLFVGFGLFLSVMFGFELEMLVVLLVLDFGCFIMDLCSGCIYFKGCLLGKVSWGVVLVRVERGFVCFY